MPNKHYRPKKRRRCPINYTDLKGAKEAQRIIQISKTPKHGNCHFLVKRVVSIKRGGPLNFALLGSPLFNQPGGCEILSCTWDLQVFNQEGGQLKVSGSSFAVKGDSIASSFNVLHLNITIYVTEESKSTYINMLENKI